jgi:hypothetical protein
VEGEGWIVGWFDGGSRPHIVCIIRLDWRGVDGHREELEEEKNGNFGERGTVKSVIILALSESKEAVGCKQSATFDRRST